MSSPPPDDTGNVTGDASGSTSSSRALPPMALLATLQTAWAVQGGIGARRDGRDPAAQEPPADAHAYLEGAARELMRLHMQLLMAKVQSQRGEDGGRGQEAAACRVAAVRRFDMLMKLRRVGQLLHGAHQRLMSLYPAVSEELVEEARRCRGALDALPHADRVPPGEGDAFGEPLEFFLQRLLSFAAWLQREL